MKIIILTIAIPTAFILATLPVRLNTIGEKQRAHLGGVVTDSNEARLAKAKLIIERNHTATTVVTNDDGTFEADLSPGIYQITVGAQGFCRTTRAEFELKPSDSATLNFVLVDCALEYTLTFEGDKFKNDSDRYKMPFSEESFFLGSQSSPQLNVFVQFGEREEGKGIVKYGGFKLSGGRSVGATLTYNLLTLHADTICFDRTTSQIQARGNVVVEDGRQTRHGNGVSVKLKGNQALIQVEP
jgi:hypothetical protein